MERIITEPADLVGRWFVVDDDVVYYDDAEYATDKQVKKAAPSASNGRLIVAGPDEFRVGDRLALAESAELDNAFLRHVRSLWQWLVILLAVILGFGVMFLVNGGLADDLPFWPQFPLRAAYAVPVAAVALLVLWIVTQKAGGHATRRMAGRQARENYDAQRAELDGDLRALVT